MEPVKTDEELATVEKEHEEKEETVRLEDIDDPNIKQLLDKYPPAVAKNLMCSKYNANRMIAQLKNIAVDNSIPMICRGPDCPYSESCPISSVGPLGSPCPVEQIIMDKNITDYKKSLEVDGLDRIEIDAVMEMSEADIMLRRANADIAINGYSANNLKFVTDDGDPIYDVVPAVALHVANMYKKRRDKIIKDFAKTRELKYKHGILKPAVQDPSKEAANMRKRAEDGVYEEQE